MARKGRKREGKKGVENQYEITLARASAKLQVIKRADKQMKQREARGAASPRTGNRNKRRKIVEDDRTVEEREAKKRRNTTIESSFCGRQNKYTLVSDYTNGFADGERASEENARKILTSSSNIFH